jgi:hypothetical protein
MATGYIYELRHKDAIVSTGRLSLDEPADVGDLVHVAGATARVREVVWNGSEGSWRLILETRGYWRCRSPIRCWPLRT